MRIYAPGEFSTDVQFRNPFSTVYPYSPHDDITKTERLHFPQRILWLMEQEALAYHAYHRLLENRQIAQVEPMWQVSSYRAEIASESRRVNGFLLPISRMFDRAATNCEEHSFYYKKTNWLGRFVSLRFSMRRIWTRFEGTLQCGRVPVNKTSIDSQEHNLVTVRHYFFSNGLRSSEQMMINGLISQLWPWLYVERSLNFYYANYFNGSVIREIVAPMQAIDTIWESSVLYIVASRKRPVCF